MDLLPISAISSGVKFPTDLWATHISTFQKRENKEVKSVDGQTEEEKGWKDCSQVKKHF